MTLLFASLAALGAAAVGCGEDGRRPLTLGVPTTVQDSGLLDALLPELRRAHPEYRVRFIAAGSGELLALGARGDLDVLLSHSPAAELQFIDAGHGTSRRQVMENDFVIVGPPSDPAAVRQLDDAVAALAQIAAAAALFLSRGDDSGTHRKELELRSVASIGAGGPGYREVGQGMGAVLQAASELRGYALCDRATFLNLGETLNLQILVEGDPRLRNIYSVIQVSRARQPDGARAFAHWMTSDAGRRAIADYGRERFGASLFRPIS
ncbi:MAG: solute-binding protein [Gemmatimonadetes bacterium]|nr:solute-binding protein [Gemmatimonadota bacterium]NIO32934.1 solute-binding protein [Gemmatimonadota bacterium]